MGLFNPTDDSICLKVVYYGPAFGGKTTNLNAVEQILDPSGRQGVLSVNTGNDTTLFFDYLPLRFRLLDRYQIRVQGFTVPGQVQFDTTRRLVLKGCDGVVFVADSSAGRLEENRASLNNLDANLARVGLDPARLPTVLQFNKRDLDDALQIETLHSELKVGDRTWLAATAIDGAGVFETFRTLLGQVLQRAWVEFQLGRQGVERDDLVRGLESALDGIRSAGPRDDRDGGRDNGAGAVVAGAKVVRVTDPGDGSLQRGDPEQLLAGAVEAGLELAELAGSLAEENNRLVQREEQLLETVQGVVHDLRKPVCALGNLMHVLGAGAGEAAPAAAVKMAQEVLGHMSGLLDRSASLLRQGEDRLLDERELDLGELVEQVFRRMAATAHDQAVRLSVLGELPVIRGNAHGIVSVLSNLVANAIQYHAPERAARRVEICGRPLSRGYLLAVRDNGIGVPAVDRARVFDKHARAANVREIQGTGLGLHLVREIIRRHGGRVGLRSSTGQGSVFWIRLPAERLISCAAAAGPGSPSRSGLPAPAPAVRSPGSR